MAHKTRPAIVAHRGSSADHPDNSWAAFRAALAEGADAIECDVQGTADGALLVRHDLAIGARPLADMTRAEVDAQEPGIVRFADLLAWSAETDMPLLIEVKTPDDALAIADRVAASPCAETAWIGGFHAPALAAIRQRHAHLKTSLMMGSVVDAATLIDLAARIGARGVHPCWEARAPHPHTLLGAEDVVRVAEAGLRLTLWHEERPDELAALIRLAPDAICTNTPAILRGLLAEAFA